MYYVTPMELKELSDAELFFLSHAVFKELAKAQIGSMAWHEAMLSFDNIRREEQRRRAIARLTPRPPGF